KALDLLRKALRTRGYLYQQPWYAIIGPPGAGKTTALLNAGLRFPLAEQMGQGAIAGVGGTRLCDWWFTDDAVLIDTAGRYTTHNSNATVDRAGWDTFLDLLKRTRPHQPLNGLIVAFPLSDIAQAPAAERLAHAAAIRRRIEELETHLGLRMPVYVLFTKADLIAGFTEFFDDLDRTRRAQVWGTTFDLTTGKEAPVASFGSEFATLVERLNRRLFDRMQAEQNLDRRARIAMFPGQISSLEQPLMEFLQAAFGGVRSGPAPSLRGVYITSGTQEGTPIDRLIGTLTRAFGVDQTRMQALQPEQGRSYFLERLLKDVILGEAMLVAYRPGAARRRTVLRATGFAVAALLVVVAGSWLWHVRDVGQREIDSTKAALAGYEQIAQTLPLDPVADDDLPRLATLLDRARGLPHSASAAAPQPGSWLMLGLSQQAKLAASSRAVYRHALEWALLPRLIWRLEAQLRGNLSRPDFLYEATRIYLMLGNQGPLDAPLVHEWMKLDWQAAYPGAENAALRASLLQHLDALLAAPLPPLKLDGDLVTEARSRFAAVTMAERVYSRIRPSAAAQRIPPWRSSDALGPAGVGLFVRASGKPLSDGIPGFFTADGFHKVLLPSLSSAAKSVASESWVLGKRVEFDPDGPQTRRLEQGVIELYEADYAAAWDSMLADLNMVQERSVSQAAQDLYILASPESPMRSLLVSISGQLTLATAPETPTAPAAAAAPSNGISDSAALRLQAVLGKAQPTSSAAPMLPGREIDEHYKALRDLVGDGPGAPIDQVLRSLGDMQQQLAKMAATVASSSAAAAVASGIDPSLALRAEALRQPLPLARWLNEIAATGSALRSGNPRQQLATIYNAVGGPAELCRMVVDGRYPFVPAVPDDASIENFARLFAPGGSLDGFVNTLLRPYIDMSGKVWRAQSADPASAPVSAADLAQFQRAAAIRDMFFADGGTVPSVRFDVTPVGADAASKQVLLEIDGASIVYSRSSPRSIQVTWPSPSPQQPARLIFDPPVSGQSVVQETGPWSMFRLFGRGHMQQPAASPERYNLTFQLGDRKAVFEIRPQPSANPFAPAVLQDFHCPVVRSN
ncbi:MAG TPA: type VI secretion system membrane subunit TssM, partial [Acetobacteraceae bacterium]|nr:type VI secretion system membrane subunit TssM [Acetobacteraceae bacterium]